MRHAILRARGNLGDFLRPDRRGVAFAVAFELPVGVRDLVQSVGIPHVEVARVTVDGRTAAWDDRIDDGAEIDLAARYPLTAPPEQARFLLDVHLGRLARHLRLVGIDAAHDQEADDPSLVARSPAEDRILLTRDRGLLMHAALRRASFVRATDPLAQAREVIARFALAGGREPFTRCLVCNEVLEGASAAEAAPAVPAAVAATFEEFRRCPGCGRFYWEGSHHRRLQRVAAEILSPASSGGDS
jgi:uncharacterized protein with PIN domain